MERFMGDDMLVEHGKDTPQMLVKYEDCVQEIALTKADAQATIATLQSRVKELEHVRKRLGETKLYLQQERANRDSLVACVNRDVKTIKELRTLVLALPKVEGEIADETILDLWESDAITFDALRGLLQHRQGME